MPRDRFAVPRESEAPRFLFYSLQSHDHVLRLAASAELVAQLSEACYGGHATACRGTLGPRER